MDHQAYLAGIAELYAAEVLGEGLASRWLELNSNPDQKYKLALFLQLESEAKVRLERFQVILAAATPGDAPMVSFMVAHEGAVIRIARREAVGDGSMDRELLTMLSYPLARGSPSPQK